MCLLTRLSDENCHQHDADPSCTHDLSPFRLDGGHSVPARAGYDPYFYDIDGLRPSFEEVERFFRDYQPDVVGVSAVVSTAYGYTKRLTKMLRRVCPQAKVIVGGNLAASAEILHRLAGIDICVIGEGEVVSVNLIRALEKRRRPRARARHHLPAPGRGAGLHRL